MRWDIILRHVGRVTDILGVILCGLVVWMLRHGAMDEWAPWLAWTVLCLVSAWFDWTGRLLRVALPGQERKKRMGAMVVWLALQAASLHGSARKGR